jgi:PAS domain S-box-containing protein
MGSEKDKSLLTEAAELRRQAEDRLLAKKAEFQNLRTGEETQRLVHELEVHQIELEMQNTALRQTRDDLETALDTYTDLYDFAPIGYFTLDHEGVVHAANLGGAGLLGLERSLLLGRHFGLLVTIEDRPAFADFLEKVFASEGKESCEAMLLGKGNQPLFVQIEAVAVASRQECRVAVIDITARKQVQESLRFSEERYRALFRDNPVMIVTLDVDGTMLSVNPTCASQLGYAIDELEGQSVLMLFLEDDRPAVAEQLHRCLQNPDQVYRWQFRKVHKDGGMLWVEETAQAIYDLNGSLNLLVVCQDITERKRVEEEREKLLVQLDAVLNSINEGVVIADLAGNIMTMNSSALAFHEYASVEQVRQQLHQLLDTFELTDLEGRSVPFEQWPLSRVLRGEQFVEFELRVSRKDKGTSRIGSYSGTPVQTRSGDVILAVVTVRDITEHKRAEAEIQRLASFPLMNPNPVLELDADGQMTFCNPAAKQFLEKGGYLASVNPLIPQDMPEILQTLRNKKPGQFLRSMEIDGRFFEELVYVTPQFQTVRIYTMDITERKRAEEQIENLNTELAARAIELEDANRELEAFNYTVAHDLRNPLNVISSYCQVIKELCGEKLDEQCNGYLRETYNGTLRMNRLIEALLQFSRLAHAELKRDRVDLSRMAEEVAWELKATGPDRLVIFRLAEGIRADGDANLLRVVLTNLLGNAWKYTATQKEAIIEFAVTELDGRPVFLIRDNGNGFDMANADKLFVPFQRLPGAEECRGFGIGLATVERIIRRHGGQVWAEGAIGKGSTFYFTLQS